MKHRFRNLNCHRSTVVLGATARVALRGLLALGLLVSGSTAVFAATASYELEPTRNADQRLAAQASLPSFDGNLTEARLPAEAAFFLDPKFDNGGFETKSRSGAFDANQIDAASATPASASAVGSLGTFVAAGILLLAAFNSRKRRTLVRG